MAEQPTTRGLIAATAYDQGVRVADIAIDQAGDWARRPGHIVWIGLLEPTDAELAAVQRQFGLDDLCIEDASEPHQRPKLQRYGDSLFVVARTAGRIQFGETHLFVGRGYVVSIRHGPSASYKKVRAHAEASPRLLKQGEVYILHSILDFIVDNYQAVLELVQEEADAIEHDLLAAWAAILAVPTAVAGIYGMNFDNMPELKWSGGYYLVIAFVATTCIALFANFRRLRWL